jgi:hypothetical protein
VGVNIIALSRIDGQPSEIGETFHSLRSLCVEQFSVVIILPDHLILAGLSVDIHERLLLDGDDVLDKHEQGYAINGITLSTYLISY